MQYDVIEKQKMLQETEVRVAAEKLDTGADERDQEEKLVWDVKKILEENGVFFICLPSSGENP